MLPTIITAKELLHTQTHTHASKCQHQTITTIATTTHTDNLLFSFHVFFSSPLLFFRFCFVFGGQWRRCAGPMCMRELCLKEGSFKVLKLFSFSFLRPELNVMKVVVKYNNVRSVIVHYEV